MIEAVLFAFIGKALVLMLVLVALAVVGVITLVRRAL